LVRAEIGKLLSPKVWIFLLLGAVTFSVLAVSLTLGFAEVDGSPFQGRDDPRIQPVALSSLTGAVVFVVVLSIIGATSEFRHGTATPTFLTTPRRGRVLLAKLVVYVVAGLVYAVVSGISVVAVTLIWLDAVGVEVSLSGSNRAVLLGAGTAVALYGLLGVGLGVLVRKQVGAIVGALVYLFVLEPIIRSVPTTEPVYKWLPGGAQEAMGSTAQFAPDLLARWQGGVLLLAYGAVLTAAAASLNLQRDVN
ncbi:MAG: ABC transporter permease, partial [Geodermatophilaceae bacterium]|nr:ABC transporter permease [Geodermatophilaceae bacterium]